MAQSLSVDVGGALQPLPSLPPSPTPSEDLGRATAWIDEEDQTTPRKNLDKGKARVVNIDVEDGIGSGDVSEEEAPGAYPPTSEDAGETRRIEENLRRWEQNERQRRKTARESAQPQTRSLVGDVTRRASLLWPRKSHGSHPSRSGRSDDLGNHTALKSTEDVDFVPLEDIGGSPSVSANPSPIASPKTENPFNHPSDSDPSSPFDDSHARGHTAMDGSDTPPKLADPLSKRKVASHGGRPTLLASSSSFKAPPVPQPLGLPPPLTPPPPNTLQPPSATASPSILASPAANPELEEQKSVRWWHDWLCGCSEGPDRGGDNQAGRTNPFE